MRLRLILSGLIGAATGTLCWCWLERSGLGAADFRWAILAAQDLLAHHDPYLRRDQLYPVPAAVFGLPFVAMRQALAGGVFYGLSSALLAFGISRHGLHRLLIFFAYPYWAGLIEAQWAPLILASVFIPLLLPATLAKPQLGVPILLTASNRRGLLLSAALLGLSLLVMPAWPWHWIANLGRYNRFTPLFVFPGPILALSVLRYRKREARMLLLTAVMPQRWFYDPFILWWIPESPREIIWTVFFSWGAGIWRWYHFPHSFAEVGRWSVLFLYLPMLVVILLRPKVVHGDGTSSR